MSTVEMGDILNAIGQHTADILGEIPNDVFVYIEAGDNWQGAGIFKDIGNRVIYYDPSHALIEEIERLWEAADPAHKWRILYYDIKDGRFSVEFHYPEEFAEDEDWHEHRERALEERYGEKQVVYPPPEDGAFMDFEDLPEA